MKKFRTQPQPRTESVSPSEEALDELRGQQTALADAIEALQAAQNGLADATVKLGHL